MRTTNLLLVCLLMGATQCLWTSSYFSQKNINVNDNIYENKFKDIKITTTCTEVPLNVAPYNYNGVVRSGYVTVNKGNSGLAFIFYGKESASQADLVNHPTIIWLNGGPGSSSQLGNFMELGPYLLKPGHLVPYDIVKNDNSWVKDYNVIFVDQPVGTGLSYADSESAFVTSMTDVATDFYEGLKQLYQNSNGCFNKLGIKPDQTLYIFGESYGGKYAPAIAQKIVMEAQDNQGFLTGLKGVAVGDGFTHPYFILTEAGEYAYNLGLIDYQERIMIEQIILNATHQERIKDMRGLHDSFDMALDLIVEMAGHVNVYDITTYHDYPTLIVDEYLGNSNIQTLYGLNKDIEFGSEAGDVYEHLYEDFMKTETHLVEDLLERKIPVMIYNGQNDLIVETPGTFKWVELLHHEHADEFRYFLIYG